MARHGKSVLNVLPARSAGSGHGIAAHAQIVEDASDIAGELSDSGGNAIAALGLDQAGGEATQTGEVFRTMTGAYGAAVLVPVPVKDIVMGFHAPVVAVERQ